jgi:hypothetical protein
MLRATICGSASACATSLIGPQGTPAASMIDSHCAVPCAASACSISILSAAAWFGCAARCWRTARSAPGRAGRAHQRELAEQLVVARRDDHPAVGGAEGLERRDRGMTRAERPGHLARREVTRDRVLEDGDLAVEHGDVDLAAARRSAHALEQRGVDSDRGEQAGGDVADRRADAGRRAARMAGQAHDAAHALHDHVVGRAGPVRARMSRSPRRRRRSVSGSAHEGPPSRSRASPSCRRG